MKSEVNRLQGPARDSTFALWRLLQYLAKYGSALLQRGVGHGIGQSQALLAVLPWLCKADKTRLSRNYQQAGLPQPVAQLGTAACQLGEPQPQEEGTFGTVKVAWYVAVRGVL